MAKRKKQKLPEITYTVTISEDAQERVNRAFGTLFKKVENTNMKDKNQSH